jgi:hypothetical protein
MRNSFAGASFVLLLDALCENVYQQAQPVAEPMSLQPRPPICASDDAVRTGNTPESGSSTPASEVPAAAMCSGGLPSESSAVAAVAPPSSIGHGMVVDALGSLPSIHARRSAVVDSNGATFSVDDVAARRLRKEQRRKRAEQESQAAQTRALENVADEKHNAPLPAHAETWTDVPAEFCCALNGSLIKQPVHIPLGVQPYRASALRLLQPAGTLSCDFRCRSSPNTATPSTAHASSSGCSSTPTLAPSPASLSLPQISSLTLLSKSAFTPGRYSRRCSSSGCSMTCTNFRPRHLNSPPPADSPVVMNTLPAARVDLAVLAFTMVPQPK